MSDSSSSHLTPSLHDRTDGVEQQEQTRQQEDLECNGDGGAKLSSSSCPSPFVINDETHGTKSHNTTLHKNGSVGARSISGLEKLREIRASTSRMSSISEPSSITEDDQEDPSFLFLSSDIDASFDRWESSNNNNNNGSNNNRPPPQREHSLRASGGGEKEEDLMECGMGARKRKRPFSSHSSRARNSDEHLNDNNMATTTTTSRSDQKSNKAATEMINRAHAVRWIRRIFVVVLVCSTAAVAAGVYIYTASQERHQFVTQFDSDSEKLLVNIGQNMDLTMGAADAFMLHVVAQARSSPQAWPFVPPLPDLAVQSAKLLSRTNSIYMAFYPLVQQEDRATWENFTRYNDDWVDKVRLDFPIQPLANKE